MSTTQSPFGSVGLWVSKSKPLDEVHEVAVAADRLGFGTLWVSGGSAPGTFDYARDALAATSAIRVGTSVANMWVESAEDATASFMALEADFPGRFYFGAGPSHGPLVTKLGLGDYQKPLAKSREYLDQLDAQPTPIPIERRLLGALGPLALRLALARTAGSVPYHVPPAHTTFARAELGPDAVLAPELGVVLDDDIEHARSIARAFLNPYLAYPNYTDTFLKFGFDEEDIAGDGSDRLLDGIFALGTTETIGAKIDEHLGNGADHVALQILPGAGQTIVEVMEAIAAERELAAR
jgi:probable F420-dependent oxidoreductase